VPAHIAGGDTFDYALDRDTLHLSVTDAMGHGVDAAQLATLVVGSLRNSRRCCLGLPEQARAASTALASHAQPDSSSPGRCCKSLVLLTDGDAGPRCCPSPHRRATGHPRRAAPPRGGANAHQRGAAGTGGKLLDDATVLVLDWYGGLDPTRGATAGAAGPRDRAGVQRAPPGVLRLPSGQAGAGGTRSLVCS